MKWLPDVEKNKDIFIRFDTMHERDTHIMHSIAQQKFKLENLGLLDPSCRE